MKPRPAIIWDMSKKSSPYLIFFGASAVALSAFHPSVIFSLAVTQLLLILLFVVGRQWGLRRSRDYSTEELPSEMHSSPFFSIQLATYSDAGVWSAFVVAHALMCPFTGGLRLGMLR